MPQPSARFQTYHSYSPVNHPDRAVIPERNIKPKKIRRFHFKRTILAAFFIIIIAFIVTGGFLTWKLYEDTSKLTGDKNPLALIGLFFPGPLNETGGRVNILMAGLPGPNGGQPGNNFLTDSIMIVSINPSSKKAVLLSIPRDMWVDIPGYGHAKINEAYQDGGMSLLSQVISQDFGVTPDYTALISYDAFRDAVNAVGGVRIDIQSPDPRGIFDAYTHLNLPNGWVELNGQQALNLARARGDEPAGDISYGIPDSDFTRTMYQRALLVALKNKAVTAGVIINPLRVASLADAVGNNVTTNMSLGNMVSLYNLAKNFPNQNITSVSLNSLNGQNYVSNAWVSYNEEALIPDAGLDNYSAIDQAINSLLYQ